MPAYNFHPRFVPAILSGEKRQTIREKGKRKRPNVGDTLYLYSGMRTAHCKKLGAAPCRSAEQIYIYSKDRRVQLEGLLWSGEKILRDLDGHEVEDLAKADGFLDVDAFFAFFEKRNGRSFSGYLIKW